MKRILLRISIGVFGLALTFFSHAQDVPRWCGGDDYSTSHPLAWERFEDSVEVLVSQSDIQGAYSIVINAFDVEMASAPDSAEAQVFRDAMHQYLNYILDPTMYEAPAIFDATMTPNSNRERTLMYELGPLGDGAPTAFFISIPCKSIVVGADPALRNVVHALWSIQKVASTGAFDAMRELASRRGSALYKSYENYTMNGLPMWPWEMWVNGFLVPENFNEPAPKNQWVFLRPSVSPALVTGSESEAGLDYGLTMELGHVWYRSEDYSSWWGLSAMAALTDDEGIGYGGLFRWNDFSLGAAKHTKNDETLVYISIDLYKFVMGEESRVNSAQGFLNEVLSSVSQ